MTANSGHGPTTTGAGRPPTKAGAPQPRDLLRVAFGPSLVALAVIAAVTLVQLVVANSDLTGTLGAVASMWLAVHLVPVSIAGQQLGALPLVPVGLMVWATARSTAQVTPPRSSWFVIRWIVSSAVGGPLLMAAVALAVVHDAASVIAELQTPNALQAFAGVLAVSGLGALIGVGSRIGPRAWDALGVPQWVRDAVRPAAIGAATLLALSSAVVALSLVVHWATMQDLFGITDSFFGQLSLTILSLLYLPNVVLGAAAVAVGSSAHIGFATFSAFTVFGGDIPALPVLAAAPTPPLGPIWVALLIIGAVSGVAIGQQCARHPLPFGLAFAKLAAASLMAAVGLALLALAGGGPLGNFGQVGVDQATFAPGVFFWFFVIGGLTVVMAGGIGRRPSLPTPPRRTPAATAAIYDPFADNPPDESDDPLDEADDLPGAPAANPAGEPRADRSPDEGGPRAAEPGSDDSPDPESDNSPDPESAESPPAAPPPPVKPAPDLDDVEDLMFVDADIADQPDEPDEPQPGGAG